MPIYTLKGEKYDIPENVVNSFESDNPDATVTYYVGNDIYDIPVSEREGFLKQFPDATLNEPAESAGSDEDYTFTEDSNGELVPASSASQQSQRTARPYGSVQGVRGIGDSMMDRMQARRMSVMPEGMGVKMPKSKMTIPEGFGELDLTNGRDLSNGAAAKDPVMTEHIKNVGKAVRGNAEAAKRTGMDRAAQQMRDNLASYQKTGKPLQSPMGFDQTQIGIAPTYMRDENGNIVLGENGKPIVGSTNDPVRVTAQRKIDADAERARQLQAEREAELGNAQKELEQVDADKKELQRIIDKRVGGGVLTDEEKAFMDSHNISELNALRRQIEDKVRGLEVEKRGGQEGFLNGALDAMTNPDTYTFGIRSLAKLYNLYEISEKVKNGEELTEDERKTLDAAYANNEIAARLDDGSSFMYRAGQQLGQMSFFWAQIYATGGFGAVSNIGVGAGRAGALAFIKQYGRDTAAKRIAAQIIKNTGAAVGDLAAGTLSALTVGAANTTADVLERKIGELTKDEEGNYVFENGQGWVESAFKGVSANAIEFATENAGEHNLWGLGDMTRRVMRLGGARKISRILSGLEGSAAWRATSKFLRKGGIQDIGSEIGEEELGILLNSALTGDNTLADFVDPKVQGDIIGGMCLSIGAMRAPAIAVHAGGSAIDMAFYYNIKHANDKAGRNAEAVLGSAAWSPWKERIDNSSNEQFSDVFASLKQDESLSNDQKLAVAQYMTSLEMMRGYNLASMRSKEDSEETGTEEQQPTTPQDEIEVGRMASWENGYNASTPQEMNDAKLMMDSKREAVLGYWTEDVLTGLNEDPVATLMWCRQSGISNAERASDAYQAALDYVNARSAYEGMIQGVRDDIDGRIADAERKTNAHINQSDGMIHPATLKDERKVFVVGGKVVAVDGVVNREGSDESLIVCDKETGKLDYIDPRDILTLETAINPEEELALVSEQIRQSYAQEAANKIDGVLPFANGDTYTITDEQGQQHTYTVMPAPVNEQTGQPAIGEGEVLVSKDGGKPQVVSKELIQKLVDASNMARLQQQAEAKDGQQEESSETESQGAVEGEVEGENLHVEMPTPPEGVVYGEPYNVHRHSKTGDIIANATKTYINKDGYKVTEVVGIKNGREVPMGTAYSKELLNGYEFTGTDVEFFEENPNVKVLGVHKLVEHPRMRVPDGRINDVQQYRDQDAVAYIIYLDADGERQEGAFALKKIDDAGEPPIGGAGVQKDPREMSDVEKQERGERLQKAPAVDVATNQIVATPKMSARKAAEAWWSENVPEPQIYNTEVGEVVINKNSVESSLAHRYGQAKLDAITSLVEGFENAVYLGTMPDTNRRETQNHYFAYPINYNGQRHYVFCRALQDSNTNRLYVHEVFLGDNIKKGNTLQTAASKLHGGIALYRDILANVLDISEGKGNGSVLNDQINSQENADAMPMLGDGEDAEPDFASVTPERAHLYIYDEAGLEQDDADKFVDVKLDEAKKKMANGKKRPEFGDPRIGSNMAKLKKAREAWQAEVDAAQALVDYWRAVKDAQAHRSGMDQFDENERNSDEMKNAMNELAGDREAMAILADREPHTLEEIAASMLAGGTKVMSKDEEVGGTLMKGLLSHTGYARADVKRMPFIFASAANGGLSVDAFGEAVLQAARDMNIRYDENDAMAGVNALLNVMGEVSRQRDLNDYIQNHRIADARAYHREMERQREEFEAEEREKEQAATESQQTIQGLEGYTEDDVKAMVRDHVQAIVDEIGADAEVVDIKVIGSRVNGDAGEDSDLDVLVEYKGGAREDDLFNALNDEDSRLYIEGIPVDINPITEGKSGTIDEFMQRNAGYKKGTSEKIQEEEAKVNTEPTEGQKKAGNYKMGHVKVDGYDVTIENPKGSVRRGVDENGKAWGQVMNNTYGYIRGTEGVDGDHIDIFLSDNPESGNVYVVDQVNPKTGQFDEHKVMYGFSSAEEASAAYLSNYEEGWQGLGVITGVSKEEFREWVNSSHRKTKPFADYKSVKALEGQNASENYSEARQRLEQFKEKYPDRVMAWERPDGGLTFFGDDAKMVGELLGREVAGGELSVGKEEASDALRAIIAAGKKAGTFTMEQPSGEPSGTVASAPATESQGAVGQVGNVDNDMPFAPADDNIPLAFEKSAEYNASADVNNGGMVQVQVRRGEGSEQLASVLNDLGSKGISIDDGGALDSYGLKSLTLTKSGDHVTLSKIVASEQGKGNGTRFMNDLTALADANGWILSLTPDTSFGGTSVKRLKDFYKRFGFKDNKGRNTDFETRESMVRRPNIGSASESVEVYRTKDGRVVGYQSLLFGDEDAGVKLFPEDTEKVEAQKSVEAMSDEELLQAIADNEERDRGFHIDEYDKRHQQEWDDAVLSYAQMLEKDVNDGKDYDEILENAYGMYGDVSRRWRDGGYATPERTALRAQMDALEAFIEHIENEKQDIILDEEREQELQAASNEHEQQAEEAHKVGFNPSGIRLRPLKKGETCYVERRYEENKMFSFTGKEKVKSADDVAYIFKQLETASVENTFMVLIKDGRPTIIHLGMGNYNTAPAPIEQALVAFRELQPDKVVLVHNHPSGVVKASREDMALLHHVEMAFGTEKVAPGIIIDTTSGKYGEFTMEDQWEGERPATQDDAVPVKVYNFSQQVFAEGWNPMEAFQAVSSAGIAEFISSHRLGKHKKMSLLVLNTQNRIVGNIFLPWTDMKEMLDKGAKGKKAVNELERLREASRMMSGYINQMGGVRGILYGNYGYDRDILDLLQGDMKSLNTPLMDVLHIMDEGGYRSAREDGVMEPASVESAWVGEPEEDSPRYSLAEPAPVYYSNAERAVEGIKQEKATPEQWLAMIEKGGGLKAGEDKWLGLSEWLRDGGKDDAGKPRRTLTKQEVLEFIRENEIQVEEVNYSEGSDSEGTAEKAVFNFTNSMTNEAIALSKAQNIGLKEASEALLNERYGDTWVEYLTIDSMGFIRPDEYVSPEEIARAFDVEYDGGAEKVIDSTRLNYTTEGLDNKREIALVVPSVEPWNEDDSVHFGDAGEGRAVAWVRFGETRTKEDSEMASRHILDALEKKYQNTRAFDRMTDEDVARYHFANWLYHGSDKSELDFYEEGMATDLGEERAKRVYDIFRKMIADNESRPNERVLVIDEIQSKRHQEGREKGYKGKEVEKLNADRTKALEAKAAFAKTLREKYGDDYIQKEWSKEETDKFNSLQSDIDTANAALSEYEEANGYSYDKIPDAPFEKNWHELAMKRMLRYAAENGYDKVAWTKGEQQAERYSLSKAFNSVEREDNPNIKGRRFVFSGNNIENFVVDEEGRVIDSTINDAKGKNLSELVGKDMAVRLMGLENGDLVEGENLRIGGEGMKGFYDEMLPRFMNKYGKKWGVKVGEVELPNVEEAGRKMWAVDVTPEMKESVLQGQPMFTRAGARVGRPTKAEKAMVDGLADVLRGVGIKVSTDTEAGQQVLDMANGDKAKFFRTPNGQAYGFVLNGTIYIDPRIAKADTPIHEYGHLWVPALRNANPQAWQRLKDLLHDEEATLNYVKSLYPDITDEDELMEEVFNHYSGKRGRERLNKEMREEMKKADGIFEKAMVGRVFATIRELLNRFWRMARDLFAGKVKGLEKLSLDDFADMALNDLLRGFKPGGEKKSDKAYREAIEKGDKVAARRMVDEAVKKAMPQTKVVDENGAPLVVWHGTTEDFTVFDRTKGRANMDIQGMFFSPRRDDARGYGDNVRPFYLNIKNPAPFGVALGALRKFQGQDNAGVKAREYLIQRGYDGVNNDNEEYIAFYPEQIKSADTETYDDDGKLIPLSERFDAGANDIRFQFVGERGAAEADRAEGVVTRTKGLATAKQMESGGKDAKAIKLATGWERGKDGKWRYEIPDLKLTLSPYYTGETKLGDIVDAPELFAAYPDLKDINVEVGENPLSRVKGSTGIKRIKDGGIYERAKGNIENYPTYEDYRAHLEAKKEKYLKKIEEQGDAELLEDTRNWMDDAIARSKEKYDNWAYVASHPNEITSIDIYLNNDGSSDLASVLIHELQHVIQGKEGFARGGNIRSILDDIEVRDTFIREVRSDLANVEELLAKVQYNKQHDEEVAIIAGLLGKSEEDARAYLNAEEARLKLKKLNFEHLFEMLENENMSHEKAFEYYQRIAGEVEARNAQRRAGMSAEERRASLAEETEDRRRDEQIVTYGDGGSASESYVPFTTRDKKVARDEYERMVASGSYQFKEAVQDSMLGLRKAYEAILGKGAKIEDVPASQNAYIAENSMSSRNLAQQHEFKVKFMDPLLEEVGKLAKTDEDRQQLTDYMMAKHGLERNRVFAERDAKRETDEIVAKLDRQLQRKVLTDEERKELTGKRNYEATKGYAKRLADAQQKDYAGLTALTGESAVADAEAKAREMVAAYEGVHDTSDLWKAVRRATNETLRKQLQGDIISRSSYDQLLNMFEYYIPLRGWDETTSDEVYGYFGNSNTRFGSIMKHAEGRSSKADDPIATIAMMADDGIRQANRNDMKQRFLNFVMVHPSDLFSVNSMWFQHNDVTDEWEPVFPVFDKNDSPATISRKVEEFEEHMKQLAAENPDKYKHGKDATTIPYKVVMNNLSEHQVIVKRNGNLYVITVNGNPRVAQALNGITNPDVQAEGAVGNILEGANKVNRFISNVYTTANPEFVVSNYLRDLIYSTTMSWVKENPRYALAFHKNVAKVNPVVMTSLMKKWRDGTLDTSKPLEAAFSEFMHNGGETGFTNIRDIESYKNEVADEIKKQNSPARKKLMAIAAAFDLVNKGVENSARFAAFLTSKEMGRSTERSIHDAKEVSVNFNKKGSGGKMVNATGQTGLGKFGSYVSGLGRALYVFWNAGVQGLTNIARAAKRNKGKFAGFFATQFAMGAFIPILNSLIQSAFGDDDDDDKNAYYNLPEYLRRSNICIWNPFNNNWITIPLPIEFRAIYGLGELATGVISGKERYSDGELAAQTLGQLSQILPIDFMEGGGGMNAFIPSLAKPVVEASQNETWTGLPLYKETPWNETDPEWTKAYSNTDKTLVGITKWLNEATGGDDFKSGAVDINPAQVEYLLNGYFGGYFNTVDKLKKMGETALGDRDFDWRNMLIASRVIKTGDDRTEARKLLNDYYKYKAEAEEIGKLAKEYEKAAKDDIFGYAERIDFLYHSPEYLQYQIFQKYADEIEEYDKAIKSVSDEDTKKLLKDMRTGVIRTMVDEIHAAEDSGQRASKDFDGTMDYKEIYERQRTDDDILEDTYLNIAKRKAKAAGDKQAYKDIDRWQRHITATKKNVLGSSMTTDEAMDVVRGERRKAFEQLGISLPGASD